MKLAALAGVLLFTLGGAGLQSQQTTQQTVPDAPLPSAPAPSTNSFSDLKQGVTPGAGTTAAPADDSSSAPSSGNQVPGSSSALPGQSTAPQGSTPDQQETPDLSPPSAVIHTSVNEVLVPVTVRDKKGALVPGLTWRQFRVFDNGVRQRISYFTSDPYPLSVAFVIDQSLPADVMNKVNESLSAVTGAFGPADSMAVFGYNNSPHMVTDYTAMQGSRINVALSQARSPGRDMGVIAPGGPMDNGIVLNDKTMDPNTTPEHGMNPGFRITPKEYHPLNDALLAAAESLAKQPSNRRRVIYIVSDGKEEGSHASYKEVVRYMLTNNISVYGTLVGDSAVWGLGYLDKLHIPMLPTMRDNLLPKYSIATGGTLDSELSENGIQMSFSKIANSLRSQYSIGYLVHGGMLASNFHTIEVRIEGVPNLQIITRDGYYPSAHMNGSD